MPILDGFVVVLKVIYLLIRLVKSEAIGHTKISKAV